MDFVGSCFLSGRRKSKPFVFEDIAPLVTYIRISEAYFKGQREALNGRQYVLHYSCDAKTTRRALTVAGKLPRPVAQHTRLSATLPFKAHKPHGQHPSSDRRFQSSRIAQERGVDGWAFLVRCHAENLMPTMDRPNAAPWARVRQPQMATLSTGSCLREDSLNHRWLH